MGGKCAGSGIPESGSFKVSRQAKRHPARCASPRCDLGLAARRAPRGGAADVSAADEIVLLRVFSPRGALMAKTLAIGPSGAWRVAKSYGNAARVTATTHAVGDIRALGDVLTAASRDPAVCAIRGGVRERFAETVRGGASVRRLLYDRPAEGVKAAFEARSRRWAALDMDNVPLPPGVDPIRDGQACIAAATALLPPEFAGATTFVQFSASHGIKPGARLRLWYWLDREVSEAEAKLWLDGIADLATFRAVQPIYTAAPVFPEGVPDFLPQRCGLRIGAHEAVTVPPLEMLRAEIGKPRAARAGGATRPAGAQPDREPVHARTMAEALAMVGDAPGNPIGRGLHDPLKVAARLGIIGERLDAATVRAAMETALLGCSHTRDAEYIEVRLRDIPTMIRWFVMKLAEADAGLANGPPVVEAPFVAPTGDADEAAAELALIVHAWITRAGGVADERLAASLAKHDTPAGLLPPIPPAGEQGLAAAGLGIGKSRAALQAIGEYLAEPTPFRRVPRRVVYVVPDHPLAVDLAARFRAMFPDVPCQIHLGIERPDPDAPGFDDPAVPDDDKIPMCRRLADVLEVLAAGGAITALCGSKARGFCPHHPRHPDATLETVCGRQKASTIKGGLVFLAGPAALTQAPPGGFRRSVEVEVEGEKKRIFLPPADIVVADEPRMLSMLGGCADRPYDAALPALTKPLRRFPGEAATGDDEVNAADVADALYHLVCEVSALPYGPLRADAIRRLAKARDWSRIRRSALTFKADPENHVRPDTPAGTLYATLKKLRDHNGRLFLIARLTRVLAGAAEALDDHPDDAASGRVELVVKEIEDVEVPALRLRWVEPIADAWAGTPTLLLDGTADPEMARQWFPRLAVIADAQAATPACVTRTQTFDDAFAYVSWAPREAEPPGREDISYEARRERTAHANVARLARLLTVRCAQYRGQGRDGIDVLAVVPMRTEEALAGWFDHHGGAPAGLALRHFNALRGQDGFGGVRALIIVSRPQPPASELERLAWTLTGVRGIPAPPGALPLAEAAYLMRDGTGRRATVARHPDAWAERVRVALTDAELVQAEGRGRAVRRTPDRPLAVELMTNLPLPLEIAALVPAEAALADAHPARWLVAAGVVPVLGAKGVRAFLGAVLDVSEEAVRHHLMRDPVWEETLNAAAAQGGQTPYEKLYMANGPLEDWHVRLTSEARYATHVLIAASTLAEAEAGLAAVGVVAAEVRMEEPATPPEPPKPTPAPEVVVPAWAHLVHGVGVPDRGPRCFWPPGHPDAPSPGRAIPLPDGIAAFVAAHHAGRRLPAPPAGGLPTPMAEGVRCGR